MASVQWDRVSLLSASIGMVLRWHWCHRCEELWKQAGKPAIERQVGELREAAALTTKTWRSGGRGKTHYWYWKRFMCCCRDIRKMTVIFLEKKKTFQDLVYLNWVDGFCWRSRVRCVWGLKHGGRSWWDDRNLQVEYNKSVRPIRASSDSISSSGLVTYLCGLRLDRNSVGLR